MQVAVLVKYVPEPAGTPSLGPDNRLVRAGVEGALDPGDEFAVEAALQLTETHGGEVTLVSMGPELANAAVRKGFSMGAHAGVLITDATFEGADALATARVLAAALSRATFDLVLAGVESTDGYTGTTPMTVAELAGLPSATFARKVEVTDGTLRVERQTEAGYDVVDLPAAGARHGDSQRRRTAVPDPEGHHGGQVQAAGTAGARRPRPLPRPTSPPPRPWTPSSEPRRRRTAGVVIDAGDDAAASARRPARRGQGDLT